MRDRATRHARFAALLEKESPVSRTIRGLGLTPAVSRAVGWHLPHPQPKLFIAGSCGELPAL